MPTLKLENKQYLQNIVKENGLLNLDLFVCETAGKELHIYQSGFNPQYHTIWYFEEKTIGSFQSSMIAKIHSLDKGMYLELYEGRNLSIKN